MCGSSKPSTSLPKPVTKSMVHTYDINAYAYPTPGLLRELLVELFPKAFKAKGTQKLPLKIGIHKDLAAKLPQFTPSEISAALADYTGGPKYLGNMDIGRCRHDLQGHCDGVISQDASRHAMRRLADLEAKWHGEPPISTNAFLSPPPLQLYVAPGLASVAEHGRNIFNDIGDGNMLAAGDRIRNRDARNVAYGKSLGTLNVTNNATVGASVDLSTVRRQFESVLAHMRGSRKIEAIKEVRAATGMGLKEAKDWVEGIVPFLPVPEPVRAVKVAADYKADGFLVLKRGPGGDIVQRTAKSYRDDAEEFAKREASTMSIPGEIVLVEVLGKSKPVFSLLPN